LAGQWKLLRLEERDVPATIGFAIGSGPNNTVGKQVQVYSTSAQLITTFDAFPNFGGGAHVAIGDVSGDGIPDVVVGAGPGGGPHVKVYDGAAIESGVFDPAAPDAHLLKSFFAYADPFRGGVFVAVGDANGDGHEDIVTGAGPGGGPHVKAFNYADLSEIYSFFAYDRSMASGVSVAAGNVGGDTGNPPVHSFPSDEIVTGAGPGAGPDVRVFSVNLNTDALLDQVGQFFAYDPSFRGGVNVATAVVTNNRDDQGFVYDDIVTGAGPGGGPHVEVWRLFNGQGDPNVSLFTFVPAASFFAYDVNFTGGVQVATTVAGSTSSNALSFITTPGPSGGSDVKIYGGLDYVAQFGTPADPFASQNVSTYTPPVLDEFFAYDPSYTGGTFVG
jgi:hypothetical protein